MKSASDAIDLKCTLFSAAFALNFTWNFLRRAAPISRASIESRPTPSPNSGASAATFAETAALPGVRLIRHAANRGKGAALKTAFAEILRAFPDAAGVVTADADGQHLPEDIRRVAAASAAHADRVTLGVRSFGGRSVPFRSRLGNLWTCGEFFLLTGIWIRDTQTGLRGIPRARLPRFAALAGDRYDYEARMLVAAAKLPQPPVQVPITTVYENGNGTSHYRPLADTFSTQAALIRAALH